jgi:uncharacterized protein (TIGR02271 family)
MRTITALYDSREHAEAARSQLTAMGIPENEVRVTADEAGSASGAASQGEHRGFLAGLKDFFMPDEDRHAYHEGVRRGGYLLTARVGEERADAVCRTLDESGAVDFDARQQQWRSEGWTGRDDAAATDKTIPVVEEQLRVGKRDVERGGVRVRSYVEETPVEEQVELHEEHVEVDRIPVNETVRGAEAENLFRERSIELTEHAEEAVVGKEAVVREEIGVRKDVDRRTETISDTVRRTKVDVDDTRAEGMRLPREGASFASPPDSADHSVAMDPEGSRVEETEEERRRRLENESRGDRPSI